MNFEEELTKGNFTIPECSSCKKIVWPPAEFCDVCYNETRLKSGQFTGKIIEFSKQGNEYFCMVEFVDSFRLMVSSFRPMGRLPSSEKYRPGECPQSPGSD